MSRLFIFGIGGTGSRVIKSLLMLLASGVNINATSIVPILIDPDDANGDFNRTIEILKLYQDIRKELEFQHNSFFKTEVLSLDNIIDGNNTGVNFRMNIPGITGKQFADFIQYTLMNKPNQMLTELLYSDQNLSSNMNVGFKGNPNIGSVVLNRFKQLPEFLNFSSCFTSQDRIMVIGSIFGGTGAAGLPLLIKNIRLADGGLKNAAALQGATIGAISVLPYFGLQPNGNSSIDSNTFIAKTKAALYYYIQNLNPNINALYYIAQDMSNASSYTNQEGGIGQQNNAHFIELASGLAVVDFMNIPNPQNESKEFGVSSIPQNTPIYFSNLGTVTNNQIKSPLTSFMYFTKYINEWLDTSIENKQPFTIRGEVKLESSFKTTPFFQDLIKYTQHYTTWLQEMSNNTYSFTPFQLDGIEHKNLFHLVNGLIRTSNDRWKNITKGDGYYRFENHFNQAERKVGDIPINQKFMAVVSTGIRQTIKEELGI